MCAVLHATFSSRLQKLDCSIENLRLSCEKQGREKDMSHNATLLSVVLRIVQNLLIVLKGPEGA